jgi:nicotinate-nucleotide adenylyltransferase
MQCVNYRSWAILLLSLLYCLPGEARPVSTRDIRQAKKIGLMPGTFDPVTLGHVAAATAAVSQGGLDFVILTPLENPHKNPIRRTDRLAMIALAASELPDVRYAEASDRELYPIFAKEQIISIAHEIRKLNPKAEVVLVGGSDFEANRVTAFLFQHTVNPDSWIDVERPGTEGQAVAPTIAKRQYERVQMEPLNVSSSATKAYLQEHQDLYATPPWQQVNVPGLSPAVARFVLDHGLYQHPPDVSATKGALQRVLGKFWKQ